MCVRSSRKEKKSSFFSQIGPLDRTSEHMVSSQNASDQGHNVTASDHIPPASTGSWCHVFPFLAAVEASFLVCSRLPHPSPSLLIVFAMNILTSALWEAVAAGEGCRLVIG